MTKEQQQVKEFMLKAGQECPSTNKLEPSGEVKRLRVELIDEELQELADAMFTSNRIEIADAIADLMYVVLGTAVAYGIDIEPIFQEVHRSNMSKFIDGYRRKDGKWIKGPSFTAPCLQPILDAQV